MLDQRRAIQIYLENQDRFKGMPQSEAVGLIRRSGGLPSAPAEAAPPQAAASMAPPEAAPAPEAPPVNPYEIALAAYNQSHPEGAAQAPAAKGAPVDYAAQARKIVADRQREDLMANAEIARTAKVDPETQALIDKRQSRYDAELGDIDKDRKQATWMAIAQAGMKMAQSQSPYWMQALASGMEAGVNGYSEAKAKAAEKKARLQDSKEDLAIKAIDLRNQAIKDAVAARQAAKQGAAADAALLKDTLSGIVGEQTAGDVIESAKLGNQQTRAQIDNIRSTIAERAASGARADRALAIRGSGGTGGTGGVKLSQLNPVVNGAIAENARLAEQLNDPLQSAQMSPAEKRNIKATMQANDKLIRYGRSMQQQKIGMGSGFKILGPA
jgi:hypothetical protein